jgi:hypothetical protein
MIREFSAERRAFFSELLANQSLNGLNIQQ